MTNPLNCGRINTITFKGVFSMKKYLLLVLTLVLVMFSPITSQAKSEKTKVNDTIKQYFKLVKKSDIKGIDKMAYSKKYRVEDASEWEKNKYVYSYIKKYNKKVTYKILSTSVKGKSATVKLSVKYVDSTDIYPNLFLVVLSDSFAGVNIDAEDYMERAWKRAVKMSDVKMKTRKITVKFQKKNGKWLIKSKNLANIAVADLIHSAEQLEE